MPRPAPALLLLEGDRQQIRQWVLAFGRPQQVALRSQIVLAAAEGHSDSAIAQQLDVNRKTVTLWRARFTQEGLDSLWEVAPGRGRKPTYDAEKIQSIVDATLRTKPKGMTQWSCRLMAARQGVSKSTINNIWRSHNLKPHRVKPFKLSRDAKFLEKLTDVVGLYLNPPQQAIVLCGDEKSQIQALDRTQPGLPLKKGRWGTMTHDYKRNGTTSLFAALEVLQGRVIGQCYERHRQPKVFGRCLLCHADAGEGTQQTIQSIGVCLTVFGQETNAKYLVSKCIGNAEACSRAKHPAAGIRHCHLYEPCIRRYIADATAELNHDACRLMSGRGKAEDAPVTQNI